MEREKKRIIAIVCLVLIVLGGATGLIFRFLALNVREKVAASVSVAVVEKIRERFVELVTPAEKQLLLLKKWSETGDLAFSDAGSLNRKLIPVLDVLPLASGVTLVDSSGREYDLLRREGGWRVHFATAYQPGMNLQILQTDPDGNTENESTSPRKTDPRTLAWFAGAQQKMGTDIVYWTEPYNLTAEGNPGVTGAIWCQEKGERENEFAAAVSIRLNELQQFLEGLKETPGMQILFVHDNGVMVVSGGEKGFVATENLADGPAREAALVWSGLTDKMKSQGFISGGEQWWACFRPLQKGEDATWIATLFPESDIEERIGDWWVAYAVIAVVLFLLLFAALFTGIWHYSRLLQKRQQDDVVDAETVRALIARGEGDTIEFKSSVRTNLKSGRRDKAMELVWLKAVTAFMNSDGGTLLLGVADNGDILGLEADDFENDDKCLLHIKNLLHEHIGSEFTQFIRSSVIDMEGKKVVAASCLRADVPVFLKMGKNEEFYVRSGPSSTKLTMSQMVAYLARRSK